MMTRLHNLLGSLVLIASLTSCGTDVDASDGASKGNGRPATIAGNWSQETGSAAKGMTLQFDSDSDEMLVHTAPAEDGTHEHLHGTYTFDAGSGAVTVSCALAGKGNGDRWTGKVDGEHLSLTAGSTTLKYHQGGDPHGGHEHDEHK